MVNLTALALARVLPLDAIIYLGSTAPQTHPDIARVDALDPMHLVDVFGWRPNEHEDASLLSVDMLRENERLESLRGFRVILRSHAIAHLQDAVEKGDSGFIARYLSDTFAVRPPFKPSEVGRLADSVIFHDNMMPVGNLLYESTLRACYCIGVPTCPDACSPTYFPEHG